MSHKTYIIHILNSRHYIMLITIYNMKRRFSFLFIPSRSERGSNNVVYQPKHLHRFNNHYIIINNNRIIITYHLTVPRYRQVLVNMAASSEARHSRKSCRNVRAEKYRAAPRTLLSSQQTTSPVAYYYHTYLYISFKDRYIIIILSSRAYSVVLVIIIIYCKHLPISILCILTSYSNSFSK